LSVDMPFDHSLNYHCKSWSNIDIKTKTRPRPNLSMSSPYQMRPRPILWQKLRIFGFSFSFFFFLKLIQNSKNGPRFESFLLLFVFVLDIIKTENRDVEKVSTVETWNRIINCRDNWFWFLVIGRKRGQSSRLKNETFFITFKSKCWISDSELLEVFELNKIVNFFGSNKYVGLFGNKNLIEKSVNILYFLFFTSYLLHT
jgi:hypothetical protein